MRNAAPAVPPPEASAALLPSGAAIEAGPAADAEVDRHCAERAAYVALPHLRVGLELLDLDIPPGSVGAAGEAIRRHMEALHELPDPA